MSTVPGLVLEERERERERERRAVGLSVERVR